MLVASRSPSVNPGAGGSGGWGSWGVDGASPGLSPKGREPADVSGPAEGGGLPFGHRWVLSRSSAD